MNCLSDIYCNEAQNNKPSIESICDIINRAANKANIIGKIFEAFATFIKHPNFSCYDIEKHNSIEQSQTDKTWSWQVKKI
ncbi:hypothetical protein AHAS_Ahas02G0198300 [Arachis hypogaea]